MFCIFALTENAILFCYIFQFLSVDDSTECEFTILFSESVKFLIQWIENLLKIQSDSVQTSQRLIWPIKWSKIRKYFISGFRTFELKFLNSFLKF